MAPQEDFFHQPQEVEERLYDEALFPLFFKMQQSTLARQYRPFTILFVRIEGGLEANIGIIQYITRHLRDTDSIFRLESRKLLTILMPFAGEKEAFAYVQRLRRSLTDSGSSTQELPHMKTVMMEIRQPAAGWQETMEKAEQTLEKIPSLQEVRPYTVPDYTKTAPMMLKVSLLEPDLIASSVLQQFLGDLELEGIRLDCAFYRDGVEFLASDRHRSDQQHVILISDVLPRKDGLEMIKELRDMPNTGKYYLILLSNRKTEEDMAYAFRLGVDDYIVKPLSLSVLEAKIRHFANRKGY
ncbi:response regulator transcription factor [Alkalicoccus chagannorensis]|uniref:response regulator transcription factor n=1 Tax=Alkalicoccus chagannorensis TaxID=427072 RepID=UPI0003F95F5F|nr:response regulator [Alkalicoccus chagannorensis]